MPFVEVKSIKGVFTTEEKARIIKDITNVFAQMKNEKFAEGTWVVINELDDGNWGEGRVCPVCRRCLTIFNENACLI